MTVSYEWVIERLDGPDGPDDEPEITDVNHADTYAEALEFADGLPHFRIALVRDHDDAGYSYRAWAYVEGAMLPTHCEDAFGHPVARVPDRYRRQFDKAQR